MPETTITLTGSDILTLHRALMTLHYDVATDPACRSEHARRQELEDIAETWTKIKAEAIKLYPDPRLLPASLRE